MTGAATPSTSASTGETAAPLRLGRYRGPGGRQGLLVEREGRAYDLQALWRLTGASLSAALLPEICAEATSLDALLAALHLPGETWPHRARLAAPFHHEVPWFLPGKIVAVGRNYADHARELGNPVPAEPIFFAKLPSCLVGDGEAVVLPAWLQSRVDAEAELAVLLGRRLKQAEPLSAAQAVAGYTCANDVTARALQKEDAAAGRPWLRGKCLDTFCPLGPALVPRACVPDPGALEVVGKVGGVECQRGRTASMLLPVAELLARLSHLVTLEPGDVVLTGTPAGVTEIQPGQLLEVEVPGVGHLANPVVRAE